MEQIKNSIRKFFEKGNIAGMSVAVTNKNGIILSENYGVLNSELKASQTIDTALYRIASVSKLITGMTVMKLVEESLLELDTPVKKYVPDIRMSKKETEENVTLRQLLSHTSGLPAEYEPDGARDEASLKKAMLEDLPGIELLSALHEKKFCYSNWGIRLASYIAQSVTGECFSELAQRLIIAPLGMKLTTYDPLIALTYPVSMPHTYNDCKYEVIHKINENAARYAAGGLFSNTEDLCRLAGMILNKGKNDRGEQVLTEISIDEMFSVQSLCQNNYYAYGLTTMFFEKDNIKATGHLGSHPPYASSLIIDRDSGIGIVTLMNTYNENLRLDIPFDILKKLKGLHQNA